MIGFAPGDGPLHRAHPFTPMTFAGAVSVLAFALPAPRGSLALLAATVALPLVGHLARVLRTAAVVLLPFWIFLVILHAVLGDDPARAAVVGARISAIVIAFLVAVATVHPGRLVDALVERGAPFGLAYLLAATLQAVPRLRDRARQILDVQRTRGLRVRGSPLRGARAVVPLALPLVLSALAEVDQRAMALEIRGASAGTRRTAVSAPPDTPADRAVRWLLAGGTLVALAARVWG